MTQAVRAQMSARSAIAACERTFSRASWIVLLVATSALLLAGGQKAYRLMLPTDGWQPAVGPDNLIFERNVLGFPSTIRWAMSCWQLRDRA